jgi:hypothetical protein
VGVEARSLAAFSLDLLDNVGVWAAARWGGGGAPALQLGIGLRCGLAIGRCDAMRPWWPAAVD